MFLLIYKAALFPLFSTSSNLSHSYSPSLKLPQPLLIVLERLGTTYISNTTICITISNFNGTSCRCSNCRCYNSFLLSSDLLSYEPVLVSHDQAPEFESR